MESNLLRKQKSFCDGLVQRSQEPGTLCTSFRLPMVPSQPISCACARTRYQIRACMTVVGPKRRVLGKGGKQLALSAGIKQ